jgi:small nuclear ribonucleoprotein (snRNP)-like protein
MRCFCGCLRRQLCWIPAAAGRHCRAAAEGRALLLPDAFFVQGTLRGYDQATNLILDECHERVFSSKVGASISSSAWRRSSGQHVVLLRSAVAACPAASRALH